MIALYARVSTEDQVKGYSLEEQISLCRKMAGTNEIIEYIDEGYTGEILNRPYLTKMRDDIQKGLITKVICYDPDRLSRKLMNQLLLDDEFKKAKVKLVFVNGEYANTPEGLMFFSMRGAISEFEKAKIKQRTSGGRLRKAKKGLVVKNGNLYGYDFNKKENTYIINENEAKFIRMIFDYYTQPNSVFKGINGIANHLTEIGAPTKKGAKVWHRQVVRQILMNEAYMGNYIQNRWDTVGDYVKRQAGEKVETGRIRPQEEWIITKIPPIITKEQFEYAQQLLEQGRRRHTNQGIHSYLLSGLIRCGRCGCTMTGKKTLSHGKDFYNYVCQKNYAGAKSKGCGRMMSENKLNHFVWENLIKIFTNPEEIKEFNEDPIHNYIEEELATLQLEMNKTKKGRTELYSLLSEEDIDKEEVKAEIRKSQQKEKELTNKYNQLIDSIKAPKENQYLGLEKAIEEYMIYKTMDIPFEVKQHIIRLAVKEITIIDSENVHIQLF